MSTLDARPLDPIPSPAPRGSNALGLTGFILSLAGLVTCGGLAPFGLIFSLIGVFRRPRGFAVAGLCISAVGVLILGGIVVTMVMGGFEVVPSLSDGYRISGEVQAYRKAHNGAAPQSWADLPNEPATGAVDHWGHPYRYTVDGSRVELVGRGPDGIENTSDDVHVFIDGKGNVSAFVGRPPPYMR
jgi:hypothetical protein